MNMAINLRASLRIQKLNDPSISAAGIALSVLRLDEIHPLISGNKWFKLQYYLRDFQQGNFEGILTFGGAYSNHLHATAALCQHLQIPCRGLVRGFHAQQQRTPTLQECADMGMELHFIARETYRNKTDAAFIEELQTSFPRYYVIPEGGDGPLGLKGAEEIGKLIPNEYDLIVCAVGTGTTLSGIVNQLRPQQRALGFTVMKGGAYLLPKIEAQTHNQRWSLENEFHFGGFAKSAPTLQQFIKAMQSTYSLPLDHVYNAKMLYGLFELIKQNKVKDCNVLCIHTGGLQGSRT